MSVSLCVLPESVKSVCQFVDQFAVEVGVGPAETLADGSHYE